MATKETYQVKEPFTLDELYKPGSTVELYKNAAEPLLEQGVITKSTSKESK